MMIDWGDMMITNDVSKYPFCAWSFGSAWTEGRTDGWKEGMWICAGAWGIREALFN